MRVVSCLDGLKCRPAVGFLRLALQLQCFLILILPLPELDGIQFPDKRRSCSLKLSTCVLKSDTRSFS
ncbi:hypothetical protein L400_04697, partial [Enterobacter hormaechei]